jgi:1-acyl-sn-glycerol-3-phosphate acyltransferase
MKKVRQKDFGRFDMSKPPQRQKLRWLINLLSFPDVKKHNSIITKIDMDDIEPPYLLFVNHNAFLDFKVAAKATYPHKTNSVVAIDGFLISEMLLRMAGCICKRKFTSDYTTVKHLKRVIKNGDIAIVYPEARYSLCGTTALLPDSLGKLVRFLKVPLVVIINHGHHSDILPPLVEVGASRSSSLMAAA